MKEREFEARCILAELQRGAEKVAMQAERGRIGIFERRFGEPAQKRAITNPSPLPRVAHASRIFPFSS